MSFAAFASIGEILQAYQVTWKDEDFVEPLALPVSDHLRNELAFARQHVGFYGSEFAVCENLIYPVLKEVWKHYTDDFTLWSHQPLNFDEVLSGTPDYFLARQSHLGPMVMDKPYLLIVEAKRDDFDRGWSQCLAAMLAAAKVNDLPGQTLYGIATNGRGWEFGRLEGATLIRDQRLMALNDLEELCAAINYVFDQCRQQLRQPCLT